MLRASSDIELMPSDECQDNISRRTIKDGQICVVPKKKNSTLSTSGSVMSGSVACDGDSGGPLVQDNANQTYLIGIVSYGPDNCHDTDNQRNPDVYTDIR